MLETAANHGLYEATRRSLLGVPKELPTVWLYDARGSRLYEEITRLPGSNRHRSSAGPLVGKRKDPSLSGVASTGR